MVPFQPSERLKPIPQQKISGDKRDVILCDGGQLVIRHKQGHPRHAGGVFSCQMRGHPSAQRFADQIGGALAREVLKRFLGSPQQTVFAGRPRARSKTRIFENIDIQGGGGLDRHRHVGAIESPTGVAM